MVTVVLRDVLLKLSLLSSNDKLEALELRDAASRWRGGVLGMLNEIERVLVLELVTLEIELVEVGVLFSSSIGAAPSNLSNFDASRSKPTGVSKRLLESRFSLLFI